MSVKVADVADHLDTIGVAKLLGRDPWACHRDRAQLGHTLGGDWVRLDDPAQQVLANAGATGVHDAHPLVLAVAELGSQGVTPCM
jgi:hypothetical protein